VKRTELIKRIGREARRQGAEWKAVEGAKHDAYWLGSIKTPIPRHAEIGERTTSGHPARMRAGAGEGMVA